MPPSRRSLVLSAGAVAGGLVVGCDNPTPGTPLGTFAVTTALEADSCGGSVAETDPGDFSVTISNDHGVIFWFPDTGASSVSGALGSGGAVTITEDLSGNVDGVDGGSGPCTLDRTDTLSFVLAPGSAPESFTGSYSFAVSAASGSVCNDQLAQYGGGYGTLPCTVTYSLSGTRK